VPFNVRIVGTVEAVAVGGAANGRGWDEEVTAIDKSTIAGSLTSAVSPRVPKQPRQIEK
jgi:hypothetical protein